MAILYGTTGDGTTLPVLVDQFGNLLAKGIDGQPGTPGADGPPGPPGADGGSFPLPLDPYEGAILGWENGGLSWVSGGLPLPPGTYGPYIYSDVEGTLTVPQDVSSLLNDQQLVMTNAYGDIVSELIESSEITNVSSNTLSFIDNSNFDFFYVGQQVQSQVGIVSISADTTPPKITVSGGSWYGSDGSGVPGDGRYPGTEEWSSAEYCTAGMEGNGVYNSKRAFQGETAGESLWYSPINGIARFETGSIFNSATLLQISYTIYSYSTFKVNGVAWNIPAGSDITATMSLADGFRSLEWSYPSSNYVGVSWIKIDGQLLVDASVPGAQGQTKISTNQSGDGSVSLATGQTIVLRNNNREWIDNFYVTSLEQRIAAR
jgi:hypothetical protein